ncbi:FAD-linked oxidase C-terminal domain-containing protein [sulfur-oxidizing endosymbiont of Gigantopelta aegis]|uniref:FAD-linked oxidase C-terminal domain-containing protein n=1 Tax=sulfur-oxidizing endosymbiont of Gigantopelta aegis TaxID=2794934 RepID=UPI0018DDD790|nr:FAD-linked oxidase C-terminal domain-containing protein [sulfur-oxidizing endosymbiont of Gigantopelta aegis]
MTLKIDDWGIKNQISKPELVRLFSTIVSANALLVDEEDLKPYECDGLSAYRQLPILVILAETIEQIQQIIAICAQYQVAVVTRGAGTSLSGGALPLENGIILSLAKLNKIISIDKGNLTARVQPGVRNLAISDAVTADGLYYAPDPSSQIACSIGGNVAENAGGVHCLKYGLTVHNVLQVKVVMMDGELLEIGSEALDSPGYDLLALMHGSEGMLGVVVEVLVKLLVKPKVVKVLMASFDQVTTAGDTVSEIISNGIIPAGLELMDKSAISAAEDFIHAGYPVDAAAILLCEVDGSLAEVDAQIEQLQKVLQDGGASDVQIAVDEAQRKIFWAGRKAAFPAVGRLSPDYYCMDGTIPRYQLGKILQRIHDLSEEYGLAVVNVFHAGDGNLHPLILYDANIPGELDKTEEMGGEILSACVSLGGTITGEHGVGVEKLDQMCIQFNPAELTQFLAIKTAFDPQNLLNPGKGIPLLHRCAEFGALHVHHGQLPHPELERF